MIFNGGWETEVGLKAAARHGGETPAILFIKKDAINSQAQDCF